MVDIGSQQVTVARCRCLTCETFNQEFTEAASKSFDFKDADQKLELPKVVAGSSEAPSFQRIAQILESPHDPSQEQKNANTIIRFIAYLDTDATELPLNSFIEIAQYLLAVNLHEVTTDDKTARDFLLKISSLFVATWHALLVQEDKRAEWAARELRRILIHILGFPVVANHVVSVVFSTVIWPVVGPLKVIEQMCEKSLLCLDTASLLVNLTRIESICQRLASDTQCIQLIKQQLPACHKKISKYDDIGEIILLLYMNLTTNQSFLKSLIESNEGYFMNLVLRPLIAHPDSCTNRWKMVWSFLRNLSLTENGRKMIISNLDLYLGHILYPIVGPEELSVDNSIDLPLEICSLHASKTRTTDESIRECILDILYSLCRYRADRIVLRNAGLYEVLKHYHLAESDEKLLEKIENLVNILIREEGTEITVDDLMEGLPLGANSAGPLAFKSKATVIVTKVIVTTVIVTTLTIDAVAEDTKEEHVSLNQVEHEFKSCAPYNFVPEDDSCRLLSVNPCTYETVASGMKKFDYYRFSQFSRLRALLFQASQGKKKFLAHINGKLLDYTRAPSRSLVEPAPKFLREKFSQVYGPVNFDDPSIRKLLNTMKEAIMLPEDPEYMTQLLEEDILVKDPLLFEQYVASKLNGSFTIEEQKMFGKLSPLESEGEWFVLPRLPASKIRQQYLTTKISNQEDATPLKNLHTYDPKAEYCFNIPYCVIMENSEQEIARMLSVRILELLNEFPLGITPEMFWQKFHKKHQYTPSVPGFSTILPILDLHASEICVFKDLHHTLMFPGQLEGAVHPAVILKRLWHMIKCLLGKDPCIATDELMSQIKLHYGVDFDPLDWNFPSVNSFLSWLVEKFGYKRTIVIHRVNFDDVNYKDYLTINCAILYNDANEEENDKSRKKVIKVPSDRIPMGYLRVHSRILSYSSILVRGSSIFAYLQVVHDPWRIALVVLDDLTQRTRFHESLQDPLMVAKFNCEAPPNPSRLKSGLYAMAYVKWGRWSPFWFRVRILWKDAKLNKYFVYGIDFGFFEYVQLEKIRFMPRAQIGSEPAHAVLARLNFVKHPNIKKNHRWDAALVRKLLNTYMVDSTDYLRITLIDNRYDPILGCVRWTVNCDVMDKTLKKTLKNSFNKCFMKMYLDEKERRFKSNKAKANKSKPLPPPESAK